MVTGPYQSARVLADHARVTARLVEAGGLVELEQPLELAFSRRAAVPAIARCAQRVALGAQVLDLALGVQRVRRPSRPGRGRA